MAVPDPQGKLARLTAFARAPDQTNLHAQAHARAIIRGLRTPPSDFPTFRPDLDERLRHTAHHEIWSALQLLDAGLSTQVVKEHLRRGAEAIEFLYQDVPADDPQRIEQLFKASFAYYIAGYYARSFVLTRRLTSAHKALPRYLQLLAAVLAKDLPAVRRLVVSVFTDRTHADEAVAAGLAAGTLTCDDALDRIMTVAVARAISYYLDHVRTGDPESLERGMATVDDAILVAQDNRLVDWWWWAYCLRFLFREYDENSLWRQLRPLLDDPSGGGLARQFIHAGLKQTPPVVELWPSQVTAMPFITEPQRRGFCLKMPTSSGKTRIAELTVLQFLIDTALDPTTKVVYLAPFRSLAVEVEQNLRRTFGGMGVRVSEIYGGFEFSPAERSLVEETRVLVATPEKFDALLRFAPEVAGQVRLVIVDEGHIVDRSDRGFRFEFFLNRIIARYRGGGARVVFISAVLPNAAEFGQWVGGSPAQVAESNWRPSRLMLGTLKWDGSKLRIDYTHTLHRPFGQPCFVPRFVESTPCKGIDGVGQRRSPFPNTGGEALASAALLFAREGTTMVFVPQQQHAESFGRAIHSALAIKRALAAVQGDAFSLPKQESTREWRRCVEVIVSEMGSECDLIRFLNSGFVVHHAGLPKRVRIALEELVRRDGVRLLVATTTLAQGVNLPIKTVLVKGLQHGHGETISPMTFWNICGRAGRAMRENEGQILFWVDATAPSPQQARLRRQISAIIGTLRDKKVASALLSVLEEVVRRWRETHPLFDAADLCAALSEKSLVRVPEAFRESVEELLNKLDGHLLALAVEFDITPDCPDRLQEVLRDSLLLVQAGTAGAGGVDGELAARLLMSRVRSLHRRHPSDAVRGRLYKLGMAMSDCETVEAKKDTLWSLLSGCAAWPDWTEGEKLDLLFGLAGFLLDLNDLRPKREPPPQWRAIFGAWMRGMSAAQMAKQTEIAEYSADATTICLLVEDLCGMRLPWGINSILCYLNQTADEREETLPPVCNMLAAMVKCGVLDPVAACLMPFLDQNRSLAVSAAGVCPYDCGRPDRIVAWFRGLTTDDLAAAGLNLGLAGRVVAARDSFDNTKMTQPSQSASATVLVGNADNDQPLTAGQRVLINRRPDQSPSHYQLLTLSGAAIGLYRRQSGPVPEWWGGTWTQATVTSTEPRDGGREAVAVSVESL